MWKQPSSSTGGAPLSNLQTGGVKTFGLQLPKSKQTGSVQLSKPKAFALDDEDEDEQSTDPRHHHPLQLESVRAKRYASDAARVLAEDANAFAYDEVYDEQVAAKKAPIAAPTHRLGLGATRTDASSASTPAPAAQSRYIATLLNKSAQRKIEQESVYERNLLKERAKDDEEHSGKQKFLTSAYKEQLAAQAAVRAAQEEQDRRDEALEQAKRRGGFLGASLAMAASRNVLEGLAQTKGAAIVTQESKHDAPTSSAPSAPSPSITPAKHERAPDRIFPGARDPSADDDRSAKRQKLDAAGSHAPGADTHPPVSAPASSTATAPSHPAVQPPSAVQADAIAAVASELTSARNPLSKAEEARARLAARKAAAAAPTGH